MESKRLIRVLSALAQETRMAIYRLLAQRGREGLAAGSIGKALALPPATLSFHLRELAQAGLVRSRQQSRFIYYSAETAVIDTVLDYLAQTCRETPVAPRDRENSAPGSTQLAAKPVVRPKARPQ
jgi:ArsR family transcriptional regulator, arsenate/arsenite/antimonite-responsive transcriptional repressor